MNRVKILNLDIDNLSMPEFLEELNSGVVFTPNIDHLVKLQKDQEFRLAYNLADYKVCDSQLLFFISRFLGSPFKDKISGSDFFPAFYEYHKDNEFIKIFLLGAAEGIAAKAKDKINTKVGRRIVVDAHSPSFTFENNERECSEIIDKINNSGATVLAVGVGAPKQEKFICKYRDKMPNVKIFLAIGATIDFEADNVKRAPKLISQGGLEWFYRLLSEPKRLWKRYLIEDSLFFWLILKQKLNNYVDPLFFKLRSVTQVDSKVVVVDNTPVVQLPTHLSISEAVAFKDTCQQLLQKESIAKKIIFDFSQTTFIDSCGIGALVSNYKTAKEKEVEVILKAVSPQVMAVLKMAGIDTIFKFELLPEAKASASQQAENTNQIPITHPSLRSWRKRLLDILGGLVGLVIIAIALIPIAIAIKVDSPGPILFSQTRCGWMGKRFRMLKFRSMCVDAETQKAYIENQADDSRKIFKNDNDPRITRVGRFLRRTSLDELPQFWNVLKGEMSLVGTRPPTPDEVERYEVPEWQRLDVKPGMTGEWQVSGRSQVRKFEDIINLDLRYQQNWSLRYDLKLIIKTILIVFRSNSGAI